ncbi:MAG: glycosyltransferase [Paracoccaceae bacterium]|nr:glycosyltransferase [Paracoccaceae bacterium]
MDRTLERLPVTGDPPTSARGRLRILALPAFRRQALNPFQALLYEQVERLNVQVEDWSFFRALWRRCDIWHFHHPDTVVFPRSLWQSALETATLRLLLSWARLRGIKILWTVHDLDSSDNMHPRLEQWFWRYFLPRIEGYVCLTEAGRRLARERFPKLRRLPSFITAHGDFRPAYPKTVSKAEARGAFELHDEVPVLLSFGLIRPYKDLPLLIDVVRGLAKREAILLVAGRVYDKDVERDIRARVQGAANIQLQLRWISFEDTQLYFSAADLVVLPYRRILNSGTLMLALAFERPVMVPDRGTMRELQGRFGSDWLRVYEGDLNVAKIRSGIEWAMQTVRTPLDFSGLDWPTLAQQTRAIYDALLDPVSLSSSVSAMIRHAAPAGHEPRQ